MLDKLKQINELRKMQAAMKKERAEVEKEGVRVVINGNMELEEVKLNPNLNLSQQETLIKELVNEAIKKLQQALARNLMSNQ